MTNQTTDTAESSDSAETRIDESVGAKAEDLAKLASDAAPAGKKPEDIADTAPSDATTPRRRRSISLSLRSLVVGAVIAILLGAVGTLAWLYVGAQSTIDTQARQAADDARAEKIALNYSVDAATMDVKDLQAWKVKLVAGTSKELNGKLSEAAKSMEQILVPLQWTSSAEPLVAKVRSRNDGIIIVDCFVSVQTKTVQAPDPLQSTATYSLTIDTNNNWLITDVGGIGSAVGRK